jgi:hypothetical protein
VTPGQVVWAIRAIAGLIVLVLVLSFFHGAFDLITAPFKAELDASRGNQAAGKASVDHQNTAVDGMKAAAEAKQAESKKAVESAGKPNYARAKEISAAPPQGTTDYERAMNRIDRELHLQ